MRLKQSAVLGLLALTLMGAGCNNLSGSAYSNSTDSYNADSKSETTPPVTPSESPSKTMTAPGKLPADQIEKKQATIKTNKGDIVIEFYPESAPLAVSNFISLTSEGFYDGVIFHRVIEGFMIQGGDPTGTGRGGPGYQFADELNDDYEYSRGTVAMANAGPNTNGSQFFIMHKDYPLPHDYTIFGHVVSGLDVVDAIATTPKNSGDKPLTDVVMEKVTIEDIK
jgi:cyclophilin family peptidyl-prolyl cis-trans isomerase